MFIEERTVPCKAARHGATGTRLRALLHVRNTGNHGRGCRAPFCLSKDAEPRTSAGMAQARQLVHLNDPLCYMARTEKLSALALFGGRLIIRVL